MAFVYKKIIERERDRKKKETPCPPTPSLKRLASCACVENLAYQGVIVAAVGVDRVALSCVPHHHTGETRVGLDAVDDGDEFIRLEVVLGAGGSARRTVGRGGDADKEFGSFGGAGLCVVVP